MSDLRNEVSYSESKSRMLEECPRRYWYSVYRSWGGWWHQGRPPASESAESAFWAKHYEDANSLSGKIVHECAAWGIKSAMEGRKWEMDSLRRKLMERASTSITKALAQAQNKLGDNPKRVVRLIELEVGLPFDEEALRDRTRNRIMALTSSDDGWKGDLKVGKNLYARVVERANQVVSVEELIRWQCETNRPSPQTVAVWLAADLIMRDQDRRAVTVIDWKTGRRYHEHDEQIIQYGAWASTREFESITLMLVYLGDQGEATVRRVNIAPEEARRQAALNVRAFLNDLSERLVDGDLVKNQPIEEKFPATHDLSNCVKCPFQRMCERDGTRPASVDALPKP